MDLGPPLPAFNQAQVPLKRQLSKEADDESFEPAKPVNVLMIGTGEYTTGFVNGVASDSDKSAGVVALTMFDLRKRRKVDRLGLCGVNGTKFQDIKVHLHRAIQSVYDNLDISLETFPKDTEIDPKAYLTALDSFSPGDAITIFTPDDTHFDIALAAINKGIHVLVTKPAVKTLEQHHILHQAALKNNVLVAVEVHKRWDPIYGDARDKIVNLGDFSYLYSYMSQPKHQLDTFSSWAGKSSDISYYLNSHHIDFHEWAVGEGSRPISVTALASTGVAKEKFGRECEDTITLSVLWENLEYENTVTPIDTVNLMNLLSEEPKKFRATSTGTAIYTSSWIAPKSDVHSQQRFFYMGQKGEINVDQAHRGYNMSDDGGGYRSVNPLFMKYTPTDGQFSGQNGYGYKSFEVFIDAVREINRGKSSVQEFNHSLASIATTYRTTAILEAGRLSLDKNCTMKILYENEVYPCQPTNIVPM